jgi:hypothetical protein
MGNLPTPRTAREVILCERIRELEQYINNSMAEGRMETSDPEFTAGPVDLTLPDMDIISMVRDAKVWAHMPKDSNFGFEVSGWTKFVREDGHIRNLSFSHFISKGMLQNDMDALHVFDNMLQTVAHKLAAEVMSEKLKRDVNIG